MFLILIALPIFAVFSPLLFITVLTHSLAISSTMSAEYLATVAAIVLSLFASYLPGFSPWFDARSPNVKRLIMLALLFGVAVTCFGISCAGWGDLANPMVACTQVGFFGLLKVFIAALIANQAAYLISPKPS